MFSISAFILTDQIQSEYFILISIFYIKITIILRCVTVEMIMGMFGLMTERVNLLL